MRALRLAEAACLPGTRGSDPTWEGWPFVLVMASVVVHVRPGSGGAVVVQLVTQRASERPATRGPGVASRRPGAARSRRGRRATRPRRGTTYRVSGVAGSLPPTTMPGLPSVRGVIALVEFDG